MASGTIKHFLSEDQQCFDLWGSSLSAECVRSCFPDLLILCFFVQAVSTQLYSYENIAGRTAAYPVPCRKQWGRTKKKPYQ